MNTLHSRRIDRNHTFGAGLFPPEPDGVQCKPLPIGPTHEDQENHEGYRLGRAGESVNLTGRSAAFVAGFEAGREDMGCDRANELTAASG